MIILYTLDRLAPAHSATVRDLAITFGQDLSFVNHIQTVVSSSYRMLSFILFTHSSGSINFIVEFFKPDTAFSIWQQRCASGSQAVFLKCPPFSSCFLLHLNELTLREKGRRLNKLIMFTWSHVPTDVTRCSRNRHLIRLVGIDYKIKFGL